MERKISGTVLVHTPVLKTEVIRYLAVEPGKRYIDTTVGGGGHTEAILRGGGVVLGIDIDHEALEFAKRRLASACPAPSKRKRMTGPADVQPSWRLAHGNFAKLGEIAQENGFCPVSGILFDLGVSSFQFGNPKRGFSFGAQSLDMRFNPKEQKVTAADLINGLNEGELNELFTKLGEEHHSRRLARAICRARRIRPIRTGAQLAEIVSQAIPRRGRIHPATRIFQALRIGVNDELNNLREALPQALEILGSGGRLVVLSFHSLEDRIVKDFLREKEKEGEIKVLTRKPVRPTTEEIRENPRSRSAKLRAAEKL